MNEGGSDHIMERLRSLERTNRRFKRVGTVLAVGIAAVVLMGQARTGGKVVEAERFVLRAARGRIRPPAERAGASRRDR